MPFRKPRSGGRLRKRCAFLTGKERDTESNNDYFGARYYFAANARWLSVDPVAGNPLFPQSLDRYAYVGGDPVNITDPTGMSWFDGYCDPVSWPGGRICIPRDPGMGPGPTPPNQRGEGGGGGSASDFLMKKKFERCLKENGTFIQKGRKKLKSEEWEMTYEKYAIGGMIASQSGLDAVDVLALWGTESRPPFSMDPKEEGGGPMQVIEPAFLELKRLGYLSDPDYQSWLDADYPLTERLLAGANYFAVVLMYQMTDLQGNPIPRDQAYAVYNGGRGRYKSADAQKHLARFNRIRDAVEKISNCMEGE